MFLLNTSQAQDWANLKQFQEDNKALETVSNEGRIVFMGNSITIGWINTRPDFFTENSFVNRGISGQTTPQMLLRFRQDVLSLNPAAVVILAGINDIAGNTGPSTIEMICNNIFSMAELAEAHDIKVILCSVLPAIDFPWNKGTEPAEKVIELNGHLESYAFEHNHVYVDYFTPMANKENGLKKGLGDDGIHPNTAGYMIMEPIIKEAIAFSLVK